MARAKFTGHVRGYSLGEDGNVHLTVDDSEISESAKFYVHDLEKAFNPNSATHGYGAKDVPCNIKPGLASYYFTLSQEECRGITFGSVVEVEIDVYYVRKVRFFKNRWGAINELRHDLVSIRAAQSWSGGSEPKAKESEAKSGK